MSRSTARLSQPPVRPELWEHEALPDRDVGARQVVRPFDPPYRCAWIPAVMALARIDQSVS